MVTRIAETSPLSYARVAGLLYLCLAPLGFFGMYVTSSLIVPGDAAATIGNVAASQSLFRLGIVSALVVQLVNVVVVLLLYWLLKPVNAAAAALMVLFLLLGVPIAMLNELNHVAVLLLSNGAGYAASFAAGESQALVPLFLALHEYGISIAGVFWGLWLLPMGYLVFESRFLPRVLGILLIIGGCGYLIDSFAALILPSYGVKLAIFTFWGEVLLPLWLLIKGVDVAQWKNVSSAIAPRSSDVKMG